jgi:hypothetical protein
MPLAHGNLVDGDLSQVLQLGPRKPPLKVLFLNVLDHV